MIKPLLIGIWTAALLSGSAIFFGNQAANQDSSKDSNAGSLFSQVEFVTIEPLSVAIIRENQVKGYLIVDAVFTMEPGAREEFSIPVSYLLRDLITGSISRNKEIDIYRLDKFDLDSFQAKLKTDINTKMGDEKVRDVLIQQIDFFSNEDIRDNQLRRS